MSCIMTLSGIFSVACYLYFFAYFVLFAVFLLPLDVSIPAQLHDLVYRMETTSSVGGENGMLVDLALLLLFAVPHTVLAWTGIKKAHGIPEKWERPFYVLQSTALVHCQMHFWQNFAPGWVLWDFSGTPLATALLVLFVVGFLFLLSSTFALDHFHLFGLTQGCGVDINSAVGLAPRIDKHGMATRAHYALVAHPIMTGWMIMFWSATVMTAPRLLFAVVNTAYMVIAVKYSEEPKLEAELGEGYTKYLQSVPSFCPFFPPARAAGGKKLH